MAITLIPKYGGKKIQRDSVIDHFRMVSQLKVLRSHALLLLGKIQYLTD